MQLKQWHDSFAKLLNGQPANLQTMISNSPQFPTELRLQVYQNNYQQGLVSHLSQTFERCNAHVGDEYFSQLATSYIHQHPPKITSLQDYGATFAQHLDILSSQRPELGKMPYLPDLARLDWLCDQVYYSPHRQPWPQQAFRQLLPQQYQNIQLVISPDCRLLSSHWPLTKLWALHSAIGTDEGIETAEDSVQLEINYLEQPEHLLVYRHEHRIRLAILDIESYRLLQAISEHSLLGQLVEDLPESLYRLPELISQGWLHDFTEHSQ